VRQPGNSRCLAKSFGPNLAETPLFILAPSR
jgi:hypothetical protein